MALLLKQGGYLITKAITGKVLLKGDPGAVIHLLGPPWRTADAGNGLASTITFTSPLDPVEIKYYTIDWSTEMDGTSDTIGLSILTLSATAISAGLRIQATTNDARRVTVWLNLDASVQTSSVWLGAGETHTMLSRIITVGGQTFERTIRITVRQL